MVRSSVIMTFLIALVATSSVMHLLIKRVLISGSEWVQGAGLVPTTSVLAPWYYCTILQRQWLRMSKVDGNWSGMQKVRVCVWPWEVGIKALANCISNLPRFKKLRGIPGGSLSIILQMKNMPFAWSMARLVPSIF